MTANEYRHDLTNEQKRMTDRELAATLPKGTGVSVLRYPPYWDVVIISDGRYGTGWYIVTDSSARGRKPQKVYGPVKSRADAVGWARNEAEMWRMTHVFTPEWPWE